MNFAAEAIALSKAVLEVVLVQVQSHFHPKDQEDPGNHQWPLSVLPELLPVVAFAALVLSGWLVWLLTAS